jgi:hypothetical protein
MSNNPRYSDAQVDAAIADFRSGGEPFSVELFDSLTESQQRRVVHALEREEWATLCGWARAWRNREVAEPPPGARFVWEPPVPDDLRGLDVQ